MNKKYDQIFRENLQEIFPQVLAAFNNVEYRQVKPLPTTLVKTLQREPDFLFEVQTAVGKQLLHVDVQTKHDASMHRRMLLYAALLFDKYQLPVKQIVLYIGDGRQTMTASITMADFSYRYQLIDFRQIPYQSLLSSNNPAKVLFAILGDFGGDSDEKATTAILTRLKQTVKDDTIAFVHLQVLADLRNLGTLVTQIAKTMALDIKATETSLFKQGRIEEKTVIAKRALKEGLSLEVIAKLTGLRISEIKKLAEK